MEELALKPTEKATKTYTSKDDLRQQSPFTPTYLEWLWKHGQQIIQVRGTIASDSTDIYEVPPNHTLYLMSARLSYIGNGLGAGGSQSIVSLIIKPTNKSLIHLYTRQELAQADSSSINFTVPIIVNQNEKIQHNGANNTAVTSAFTGFLVPNNLIPQF